MSRRTVDISTSWRVSEAGIFAVRACTRRATLITRSPIRSRSVVDLRLESNWRARDSLTRVIASGRRSSICRSIRSSSFSQSLMARKAMREEFVSRSWTLKAASRAMRQALSAKLARSSGSLLADTLVARTRAEVCSSDFLRTGNFRGIWSPSTSTRSLFSQCERIVTRLGGWPVPGVDSRLGSCGRLAVTVADYLRKEFAYDIWANRETLAAIRAAGGENGRSLQLMAHILAAERVWLERLKQA